MNIINAKEALLTEFHLALVMEYATRGTLTAYVAEHWHHGQQHGLFLTEDEARYLFRVGSPFGKGIYVNAEIFLFVYCCIFTCTPLIVIDAIYTLICFVGACSNSLML